MRLPGLPLGLALFVVMPAHAEPPLFSFGVIADVQYADKDDAIGRHYRQSTVKLAQCGKLLNQESLEFVIQLGDLIDEGAANLDVTLPIYEQIRAPRRHVLGNHDLSVERRVLLPKLRLSQAYYDFTAKGWTFVVLDGMNESVAGGWPPDDPHVTAGRAIFEALRAKGASNAQTWNGAVGPEQRAWLRGVLARAKAQGSRVVVFSHFPVLAASCRPEHLLWDHDEVLQILESQSTVAAYLNGHDHKGGEATHNGILYLTLSGMVEHEVRESCQVVDVFPDALVVRRAGATTGRRHPLR